MNNARPSFDYTLSDFNYDLPSQLIAQYPIATRSNSRLLCVDKNRGELKHKNFQAILELINPGDLLVLNDTKVIPARLWAEKTTGGRVEILVERLLEKNQLLAYLKASKSLKVGFQLFLKNGVVLLIQECLDEGLFKLSCLDSQVCLLDLLYRIGHMPLPPYLQRQAVEEDTETYQTVYARVPGAVAAPTAGLHFDQPLLNGLEEKGVKINFITLHVGSGTFKPVRTECLQSHRMHAEYVTVSEAVCRQIEEVKANGKRVIAVGTTTVRALETAANLSGIKPFSGETRLFIYPGFLFTCVDVVVTNFHLPKSTLLMLVAAFAGYELTLQAYQQAIASQYRFFSYGDAMWVA